MALSNSCKFFRLSKNMRLKDLAGDEMIKNLSAFENGRSSNLKHFEIYLKLSLSINCYEEFCSIIKEGLENG